MAIDQLQIKSPPNTLFQGIATDFRDNLTYAEFLMGVLKKVNEVINATNENSAFIAEFNIKYQELLIEFNRLREEFDELEDKITEDVNQQIAEFEIQFKDLLIASQNYLIAYSDAGDARLEAQIEQIIIGNIQVVDPTTGLTSPLQTVINNIAGIARDALTATEYDGLELTATAYDTEEITAYDYDFSGKLILMSA